MIKKILTLSILFFALASFAQAAGCGSTGACFWVNGTGNVNDTTHWATASGGATTGSLPTATDNCNFDSNSSTTAYTVTVNAALLCKNFSMAAPASGKVTWAGSSNMTVSGNINLSGGTAGITNTYTGTITMNQGSGTATLASHSVTYGSSFIFNQTGTTFQLSDAATTTGSFTLTAGTFDPNSLPFALTGATPTITPTAATTFYDLIVAPAAPAKTNTLTLAGNITVSHVFTVSDGATVTNRIFILSSTVGTQRTITSASNNISNADFMDINGQGAASWDLHAISGLSGDGQGNSNITFTTPADQHFVTAGGGTWSTAANWTSRVPLPQDNVFIDKSFNSGVTITDDMPRIGKSIDFTGATFAGAFTYNGNTNNIAFGSFLLRNAITYQNGATSLTLGGRGLYNLTSGNNTGTVTMGQNLTIQAPNGTYTLTGSTTLDVARTFTIINATTTTNGFPLSAGLWALSTSNTFNATGETDLITGNGTVFSDIGILNAGTSTFEITDSTNNAITFNGGGMTFYNVYFHRGASTATNAILSNNTFNIFTDDGTAAHTISFGQSSTQTFLSFVNPFNVRGTAGNLTTLTASAGTANLVNKGRGSVYDDYLNIQHIIATPFGAPYLPNGWYAGTHSVNNQGVSTAGSGWIFTDTPNFIIGFGTFKLGFGTLKIY